MDSNHFFCQLPHCSAAIVAAKVTLCVLSVCELVCIVCVCVCISDLYIQSYLAFSSSEYLVIKCLVFPVALCSI